MMHIMARLPPTHRQPTAEICDEDANQSIDGKVVCDPTMASVVSGEHDLVPEQTQKAG